MILEIFKITLKHDLGKYTAKVTSMSGEGGAIAQVLACEACPMKAIIKIEKISQKAIN